MKNKKTESEMFFSLTWEFLNEYMPKRLCRSAATIESYTDSLTLFRRFLLDSKNISLAEFKFSDCTRDCIFDFRMHLQENGNGPSTVNVRTTAIKTYLKFAADKNVALESIALSIAKMQKCKTVQKEILILSKEALEAILSAPPNTKLGLRDRTMMTLLYDSAIRLDELLSIKLKDVTIDNIEFPCVLLHGKGNKERRVVITDRTVGHIKEYLSVFHSTGATPEDYLFYTTIKGKTDKMSHGNVQRLISQHADAARVACSDIPNQVHPHMLRRTRSTNLYQDGIAIELISVILGHANVETTKKHYAKPSIEQMRDAMESDQSFSIDEKPLWKGNEEEMARLCGLR